MTAVSGQLFLQAEQSLSKHDFGTFEDVISWSRAAVIAASDNRVMMVGSSDMVTWRANVHGVDRLVWGRFSVKGKWKHGLDRNCQV